MSVIFSQLKAVPFEVQVYLSSDLEVRIQKWCAKVHTFFCQTCLWLLFWPQMYVAKSQQHVWNRIQRFETPDISSLSACTLLKQEGSLLPPSTFYLIAILFLTPYSIIIIIVIIIFIITHQQKVTKFDEWICNIFFLLSSVWRISKWSIIFCN